MSKEERIQELEEAITTGRLQKAMEKEGEGSTTLANKLGVERAVVSKLLHGLRIPTTGSTVALKLANWYHRHRVEAAPRKRARSNNGGHGQQPRKRRSGASRSARVRLRLA